MALLLPHLFPSPSLHPSKSRDSPRAFSSSSSSSSVSLAGVHTPQPQLQGSPLASPSASPGSRSDDPRDHFYVNLGLAVRTLREDLPLIFARDLNYDIYRDDITFSDPLNTFSGIERYKLIFWALRFHGKILFREIGIEVYRIWQPSENVILIRWNLKGVPRVPWEGRGEFQGTSRYKVDRNGKIYEHKVDNLAFNFPQPLKPAASVLDLVSACPASPNPTFLWGTQDLHYNSSSWVELYQAVRRSVGGKAYLITQDGFLTCSS
ncbi:uncharacterized protein LOC111489873 [Cucurbita maxima]|uniref:Uncharacterized protein LOC111489873 n=1 Tax=Cucurbita maxima TaxID=3661 RepID=A0A6J1JY37_CUCMA|nr:uncharacterized protein LOC111489873 [Cucurbita maxima]